MIDFRLEAFAPLFKHPHLQTLAGHFWRRPQDCAPLQSRLYETEAGVRVLVQSQEPAAKRRGDVILIHGMEGSGSSGYVRSMAVHAVNAGFAVHRFHMRSCGTKPAVSAALYHGGQTVDLISVLAQFRREGRGPVLVIGFSLGGNVALKLAGELGTGAFSLVQGVCAISAPIDLEASASRIGHWSNFIYEKRFVRRMRARLCAAGRCSAQEFKLLRSIRAIDERITAPSFHFKNALEYYRTQSAAGFLSGIRVPTLIIQAKDDPFIPFESYMHNSLRSNPSIRLEIPEHGGHLGFIAAGQERFWADSAAMSWVRYCLGASGVN